MKIEWSEASTKRGLIWVITAIVGAVFLFMGKPIDQLLLLATGVAGVVGTTTPGSVIAHTHTYSKAISIGNQKPLSSGTAPFDSYISDSTGSTGGAANFGAGSSILFCVKYL